MSLYTDYVSTGNYKIVAENLISTTCTARNEFLKNNNYFGIGNIYETSQQVMVRVATTTATSTSSNRYHYLYNDGIADVTGANRVFTDFYSGGVPILQDSDPETIDFSNVRFYCPTMNFSTWFDLRLATPKYKWNNGYVYKLTMTTSGVLFTYLGRGSEYTSFNTFAFDSAQAKVGNRSEGYVVGYYVLVDGEWQHTDEISVNIPITVKTKYGSVTNVFEGIPRNGNAVGTFDPTGLEKIGDTLYNSYLLFDDRFTRLYVTSTSTLDGQIVTDFENFTDSGWYASFWMADDSALLDFAASLGVPYSDNINHILDTAGTYLNYPATNGNTGVSGYTDETGADPGTGDNSSTVVEYPTISFDPSTGGHKNYWLTYSQLPDLWDFLYSDTFIDNWKRIFVDPMDAFISLAAYPFLYNENSLTSDVVTMAGVDSEISAYKMSNGISQPVYDFGSCFCDTYYASYLDYPPYTAVAIYLPYIGIRQLPVTMVMGQNVYLRYVIDLNTSTVTALIATPNGLDAFNPICSFVGTIGTELSMYGISKTDLMRNALSMSQDVTNIGFGFLNGQFNTATNALSGASGGVVAGAAGATAGLVAGAVQGKMQAAQTNMNNLYNFGKNLLGGYQSEVVNLGGMTSSSGWYLPQQPYLLINRPQSMGKTQLSGWIQTHGRSSFITNTVSYFSGFLQADSVKLTYNSNDGALWNAEEQSEIVKLLQSGIYIN